MYILHLMAKLFRLRDVHIPRLRLNSRSRSDELLKVPPILTLSKGENSLNLKIDLCDYCSDDIRRRLAVQRPPEVPD